MRPRHQLPIGKLLREPLVHFALLGALLVCADHLRGATASIAHARRIVVTQRQAEELRADLTRRRGRPPTPDEERQEIERYVEEEALFRAALRLGLHESDTIVRRRLVQRMRFLEEDLAAVREPTDDELRAWIAARGDEYAPATRVTFEQAFFSRSKRGAAIGAVAREALETLRRGGAVAGDPYPLPLATAAATRAELAKVLGPSLAQELFALPAGEWRGPLESSYGLHLVRVRERSAGALDAAETRKRARQDWIAEQRQQAERAQLSALRDSFEVVREDASPQP
ncbi:MAG TPA: peptidylprolyl isomerase [Polyangia bacterium]|nr:peptidylprolyl isomerase [Polyangia bacterium]